MIWIVTGKKDVAADLTALIAKRGYPVNVEPACDNGVVRRMRFASPSMVIIDCDLEDSQSIVRTARADVVLGGVPLVMFAVAGNGERANALASGADAFVAKGSLDWHELLGQIEAFVGPPPHADGAVGA